MALARAQTTGRLRAVPYKKSSFIGQLKGTHAIKY
jgi:hypothetical protein